MILNETDPHLKEVATKFGLEHDDEASTKLSFDDDKLKAKFGEDSEVFVDFTTGRLRWRRNHGGDEAIARAVGMRSKFS